MQKAEVYRIATASPDDVSGLAALIENGTIDPSQIVAVLGKTEGNGCVNDFTRGFATQSLSMFLAEKLGISRKEVVKKIAFVMSGGTEGVMAPHLTVFVRKEVDGDAKPGKRLAVGVAFTRDFLPEELCRMQQVMEVARATKEAMADAATGQGLPADTARTLARATFVAAAESAGDEPLDQLIGRIASPGGSTRAGLDVMAEGGRIDRLMAEVVAAAVRRNRKMGRN